MYSSSDNPSMRIKESGWMWGNRWSYVSRRLGLSLMSNSLGEELLLVPVIGGTASGWTCTRPLAGILIPFKTVSTANEMLVTR
jgi:hypothetical protein